MSSLVRGFPLVSRLTAPVVVLIQEGLLRDFPTMPQPGTCVLEPLEVHFGVRSAGEAEVRLAAWPPGRPHPRGEAWPSVGSRLTFASNSLGLFVWDSRPQF